MKLYFFTQVYENYGTENEPYWKAKGGEDYIIDAESWTEEMVDEVISNITVCNPFYESSYIGHIQVSDTFKTDFEQSQFDYEGHIQYPAIRVNYDEFIKESV